MRRFRIVIVVLFIASAVALAASSVIGGLAADRTQPSIQCSEEPLYLSVYEKGEEALLAGVTAWDDKDGDLTGQVIIQDIGKSIQGSRTTVTYAVVDVDNHVATQSRPVEYTDYTAPQFSITQPLRYTAGERIRIRDRLHAQDVIDGDLSNRIKIMASGLIERRPEGPRSS